MTLQMMEDMRMQFLDLLSDIGFVDKRKGPQVPFLSPAIPAWALLLRLQSPAPMVILRW